MKLMVIDGNSLINRAFYGIRMLTTKDGQPTNAVYGFVNILLKLLDEEKPDALCVTFDRKAPTFRHLAYEGYKAQRKGMPDELAAQLPVLKDVLAAMNIPRYELDGWEADDLIGTIAARDTAAGWETVIVTGDKDSLQLVTDSTRVKLVSTRMGQTTTKEMTPETFREAYGFAPRPHRGLEGADGGHQRQHSRRQGHWGEDRDGSDPALPERGGHLRRRGGRGGQARGQEKAGRGGRTGQNVL